MTDHRLVEPVLSLRDICVAGSRTGRPPARSSTTSTSTFIRAS